MIGQQSGNVIHQEFFWEVLTILWNHKLVVIQEVLKKEMILWLPVFVMMTIVMALMLEEDNQKLQEENHQEDKNLKEQVSTFLS